MSTLPPIIMPTPNMETRRHPRAAAELLLLALFPGLLLGAVLVAAWPGYLSFDSAYQFWQARTGEFGDIASPLFPALWWLGLRMGLPDTTGPILLHWVLYSSAFALLALDARAADARRLAWLLALVGPCCPILLILLPHLWTDVALAGAALLVSALVLRLRKERKALAAVIVVLLFMVAAFRHNGLLAAIPLAAWAVCTHSPHIPHGRKFMRLAAVLAMLLLAGSAFRGALVEQRLDTWAVTLLFDLQATSAATGEQLIPPSLTGTGMTVEELSAALHPYSATRLFSDAPSGVKNPTIAPLTEQQRTDLLGAWIRLPLQPAYWRHRARLAWALLGTQQGELRGLAESPRLTGYRDNPPLALRYPAINAAYRHGMHRLHRAGLYSAGAILLLGLFLAAPLALRRDHRYRHAILALLASATVYTVPLAVIAPSAELRYLLWPALASWVALLLALAAPRRDRATGGGEACG